MKILAAGDIHGDSKLAEKLAKMAEKEKVELVVLCGDLTQAELSTEGILGPFVKRKQRIILIPGNHESVATADFMAELYGVKNLHGYSVKYKDVGFFGASATNIGVHQISNDETFKLLKQGFDHLKDVKTKIMVTHTHPKGSKMEKLSDFVFGSEAVTKAIKKFKPNILLCSHVHEAEGLEEKIGDTKVINVGRVGKILDI
ncbi:MAG: metallophosphoesterase [Candidatus Nanoarchaeia archaeon]|nr:metallophosphoesterase [Candidatus Nanoarchaeia archaeon]